MPSSATRCACKKRIEIHRPLTSPIQELSQWTATTGEGLRHDSMYKRSDWKPFVPPGSVQDRSQAILMVSGTHLGPGTQLKLG